MAQRDGNYMVVPGTSARVKIPWMATQQQLDASRHRVEWLAKYNGAPFTVELLEEFVAAEIPTKSEWQRKLAAARAAPQPAARVVAPQLVVPLLAPQIATPLPTPPPAAPPAPPSASVNQIPQVISQAVRLYKHNLYLL